jgi:hypothetical protein
MTTEEPSGRILFEVNGAEVVALRLGGSDVDAGPFHGPAFGCLAPTAAAR